MNVSHAHTLGLGGAGLAPGSFGDPRVLEIIAAIDMREYTRGELSPRLKTMRGKMVFKMLPMLKSVLSATLWPRRVLAAYHAALPGQLRRLSAWDGAAMSLRRQAEALCELLTFFYGEYGIPMVLAG